METKPSFYEIRVQDHLRPAWSGWFDGMTITNLDNGDATISGPVVDQAALHGLLARIRDLNLVLISVQNVSSLNTKKRDNRNSS